MARAHFVKKAQKDNSVVKKGDSYYWWKFRFGGKHYSKTHPRPSQLTQSEYLSSAYALQEQIEDMNIDPSDLQAAADELRSVADEVRNLGEEQEGKVGNMPDSLQDSDTAQMLQGRAEACEEVAGELESAADDIESIDPADEEEPQDDPDAELVSRVEDIISGIGWNYEP
jgi:chromosome segregation ATPase